MERKFGKYVQEQRSKQGSPVYFEIRFLNGAIEKVPKKFLRSFLAANGQEVHSYGRA